MRSLTGEAIKIVEGAEPALSSGITIHAGKIYLRREKTRYIPARSIVQFASTISLVAMAQTRFRPVSFA